MINRLSIKWYRRFQELLEFRRQHGHVNVTSSNDSSPQLELSNWVANQRKVYSNNPNSYREYYLKAIGFDFEPHLSAWLNNYQLLHEYQEKSGLIVPSRRSLLTSTAKLGRWVHVERRKWRNGKLLEWQIMRLESLGLSAYKITEGLPLKRTA